MSFLEFSFIRYFSVEVRNWQTSRLQFFSISLNFVWKCIFIILEVVLIYVCTLECRHINLCSLCYKLWHHSVTRCSVMLLFFEKWLRDNNYNIVIVWAINFILDKINWKIHFFFNFYMRNKINNFLICNILYFSHN